jgi:hypothetical protein
METSDILVRCKSGHIGPEALYIGQVRRTDVFRIDCNSECFMRVIMEKSLVFGYILG